MRSMWDFQCQQGICFASRIAKELNKIRATLFGEIFFSIFLSGTKEYVINMSFLN